jgi:hypothetical protein
MTLCKSVLIVGVQGFLASLAKVNLAARQLRQRKLTAVPRKPKFANKRHRYNHFLRKEAAGRHLLEHFLRCVDHVRRPTRPNVTELPPRLALDMKFYPAAHLTYLRLRQRKLVCEGGPAQLIHHITSEDMCGLSYEGTVTPVTPGLLLF